MKKFADRRRTEAPEYKIGDWVWLSLENIATNQPSKKLGNKHDGPFKVIEIVSPNAIWIRLPARLRLSTNVINVSQLSLFKPQTIEGQKTTPPPPIQVDNKEQYKVEAILDSRIHRNKI